MVSSCCTSLFLYGLSFTFISSSLYLITFIIYIEIKGQWPGDDRAKYVAKYSIMFDNLFIIHHHLVSGVGHQRSRTSGDYMEVVLNKKTSLEHVSTKKKFSLYFVFLLGASLSSPPPSFHFTSPPTSITSAATATVSSHSPLSFALHSICLLLTLCMLLLPCLIFSSCKYRSTLYFAPPPIQHSLDNRLSCTLPVVRAGS